MSERVPKWLSIAAASIAVAAALAQQPAAAGEHRHSCVCWRTNPPESCVYVRGDYEYEGVVEECRQCTCGHDSFRRCGRK